MGEWGGWRRMGGMGWLILLAGLVLVVESLQPHIVFVLTDDLGFNDLSFQGSTLVKTPNIDRLKAEGAQFTDVYSQAGFCSPSRAGILSGRHPSRFGHVFNPVNDAEDTHVGLPLNVTILPQTLKKAGYRSKVIGKWHLGHTEFHHPMNRGFDEFYGFLPGEWSYFNPWYQYPGYEQIEFLHDNFKRPNSIEYITTQFTNEAMKFISDSVRRGKPSFTFLSYNTPHEPFEFLPEDVDPTVPEERQPLSAMIKNLDDNIGRLMDHLKELGILRKTLVVFTNDNGGQKFGADNFPLRDFKGFWWEGGIRVPFFAYWKGRIKPGQTINHPISLVDLYPTFQAAAQVPSAARNRKLEGKNLLRYLTLAGASQPREPGAPHPNIAISLRNSGFVRKGRWKLVAFHGVPRQLYDLQDDLSETTNLIRRHPDTAEELFSIYLENERKNTPVYAFPIDHVPNPIVVGLTAPGDRFAKNTEVTFTATSSHSDGGVLGYKWEAYRPWNIVKANFRTVRARGATIVVSEDKLTAKITFTKTGVWLIRVNAFDDRFRKWSVVGIVVSNTLNTRKPRV